MSVAVALTSVFMVPSSLSLFVLLRPTSLLLGVTEEPLAQHDQI